MIARNHPRRGNAGCVTSVAPKKLAWALILIGAFGFAEQGCYSQKSSAGPPIEFTHTPPAAQGGRERVDTISGRVRNARQKQQIVIYAHSGPWWVQPWPDHPFIPIKADSTWSKETDKGGTYNLYDAENAWTDASVALHMQIKNKSGRCSCAEIYLNRGLGYGTYSVTVRDTSHLEPAASFSMFT